MKIHVKGEYVAVVVPVITIDGPSGTGKGTLCHNLARYLGWHALDSGSLYRVLAFAARKILITDFQKEESVGQVVALAHQLQVRFAYHARPIVFLEDVDVTDFLREEQCGQDASCIARFPAVRQALLARQRAFAQPPGLVTDGRDMGTVVFPHATVKLFLDASVEERAKRRAAELHAKGFDGSLADVLRELMQRDKRDSERAVAPLKPAADAIHVNTTGLTIAQVQQHVLQLLGAKKVLLSLRDDGK